MKKWVDVLKEKVSIVNVMNLCALAVAVYTINVACLWAHHQPEVPEEAKALRKF
ncbi:cyclic lactone autoinducer peptide [Clostridium sp. Marseille-P2415]|uniref:cyclic lactone autoinducer peptide n=1 Tax=Clostridium sp. Marseille-P2415 TaxID=1805471 RepID=UPI0009888E23|nr:cyclic lactone autoinducer peptide [Clostridium sp. Marseille-P2415]